MRLVGWKPRGHFHGKCLNNDVPINFRTIWTLHLTTQFLRFLFMLHKHLETICFFHSLVHLVVLQPINRGGYDLSKTKLNSKSYGRNYIDNFWKQSLTMFVFLSWYVPSTQLSCGFDWTLPLSIKIPNPWGWKITTVWHSSHCKLIMNYFLFT